MDNCILKDNNDIVGYYSDIKAGLRKQAIEFMGQDNWEMARDMAELLLDLNGWADNENLLVLSENNGMGYTIREYEKGE